MGIAAIQKIETPKRWRAQDTSGNNNHGQIYSGRGLEFDGVSDYLTTGYGSGLNPYTSPITVSAWVKASSSGNIFFGPTNGSGQRFYIGVYDTKFDLGLYDSAWGNSPASGALPRIDFDTWYRVTVVLNSGVGTFYVNGESQFTKNYSSYAFNSDFYIGWHGMSATPQYRWDGHMSDLQVWNAAWTADDVAFDYANPEQLALNRGGTSLTNSNLKIWYPMNDGHRGQQSYVLDASNTGLGDELLTNGSFDSESGAISSSSDITGWTVSIGANNSMSLSNGQLTLTQGAGGNNNFIYQGVVVVGVSYRLDVDIESIVEGQSAIFESYGGITSYGSAITSTGTSTIYFTAADNVNLVCRRGDSTQGDIVLNSISCKPVNDKNHATTVFYGDDLYDKVDSFLVSSGVQAAEVKAANASSVTLDVKTVSATNALFLNKPIYKSDGNLFGICTAVNSTTEIVFGGGTANAIDDNDYLYTAGNWNINNTSRASALQSTGDTRDGIMLEAGSNKETSLLYLNDDAVLNTDLTVGRNYRLTANFAVDVSGSGPSVTPRVWTDQGNDPASGVANLTELITNGTMEVNDNWANYGSPSNNAQSTTQARKGSNSRLFQVNAELEGIQSDTFSTTSGTTYLVSAWVYPEDSRSVTVRFAQGGATWLTSEVKGLTQDKWNKISLKFDNTETGSSSRVAFMSPTGVTSGSWYIDDVVCVAFVEKTIDFTATHATNNFFFIANLNNQTKISETFEGTDGASLSGWSDEGSVTTTYEHDYSYAGNSSAKIVSTADDDGIKSSTYTTLTGERHICEFYVRPHGGSHSNQDQIQVKVATGANASNYNVIEGENVAVSGADSNYYEITLNGLDTYEGSSGSGGASDWYRCRIVYTEAAGGSNGQLYITTVNDESSSKTWYVDNVTLYNAETAYVDDISVKEIGVASGWTDADQQLDIPQTALQSYNQLAWWQGEDPSAGTDYDVTLGKEDEVDLIWDGGGTVSAWILPVDAGVNNAGRILDKSDWIFYVTSAGTKLGYTFKHGTTDASGTTDNAVLTAGEWAHVVMSYNADNTGAGNEPKIYVNGEQVTVDETDSSGTRTDDSDDDLIVGNSAAGTRTFHGCITEISMWNTILSQSSVNELYNDGKALNCLEHSTYIANNSSLKGYWRNNGLATWQDLTANNNDGTVNNLTETILQQAGVDASRDCQGFLMNRKKDTNALNLTTNNIEGELEDNSNHVNVGNKIDLGTSDFTVSFWVYKYHDWTEQYICSQYKDNNNRFYIKGSGVSGTMFIFAYISGNAVLYDADSTVLDADAYLENWVHITCAVDRSAAIKWYINGTNTSTGTVDGSGDEDSSQEGVAITYDGSDFLIGRNEDGTFDDHHFHGKIDDFMIYDKYLSAAEVKRNYNAGKRSHR